MSDDDIQFAKSELAKAGVKVMKVCCCCFVSLFLDIAISMPSHE